MSEGSGRPPNRVDRHREASPEWQRQLEDPEQTFAGSRHRSPRARTQVQVPSPAAYPPDLLTRGPPPPRRHPLTTRPPATGAPPQTFAHASFHHSTFHEPSPASYRAQGETDRRGSLHRTPAHAAPSLHPPSATVDYAPLSPGARGHQYPDDPLSGPAHFSRSTPSGPSSGAFSLLRGNEPTGTTSREAPPESPRRTAREERPSLYDLQHFSSASASTSSSSRSLPSYQSMTGSRLHAAQDVYRQDHASSMNAFDYAREAKKPRYESPPPESSTASRPRLSASPLHPTPSSINALLSTESSSPQDTLSAPRSAVTLPPIGTLPAHYRAPSTVPRAASYPSTGPPPLSALLQSRSETGTRPTPARLDPTAGADVEGEVRFQLIPPPPSSTRHLDSPPSARTSFDSGRRHSSHLSVDARFRGGSSHPEVWITLAPVSRPSFARTDDRLDAYRAGYNDALRAVEDGAVEIGGTSYPRPAIGRRSSPPLRGAEASLYPSPTSTEPGRYQRQSPDYPSRPSASFRDSSYPAPPRADPRASRHPRDPIDAYHQVWTDRPLSPRRRSFYDASPYERERDRERGSAALGYARSSYGETSHRFGRPSRPTRQLISCYPCRTRKLKCDGQRPCGQCVRRDGAADCKYADKIRRRGKGKRLAQSGSSQNSEDREERDEAPSEGEVKAEPSVFRTEGAMAEGGSRPSESPAEDPPTATGVDAVAEEEVQPGHVPPPST